MGVDRIPSNLYPMIGKNYVGAFGYIAHGEVPNADQD